MNAYFSKLFYFSILGFRILANLHTIYVKGTWIIVTFMIYAAFHKKLFTLCIIHKIHETLLFLLISLT